MKHIHYNLYIHINDISWTLAQYHYGEFMCIVLFAWGNVLFHIWNRIGICDLVLKTRMKVNVVLIVVFSCSFFVFFVATFYNHRGFWTDSTLGKYNGITPAATWCKIFTSTTVSVDLGIKFGRTFAKYLLKSSCTWLVMHQTYNHAINILLHFISKWLLQMDLIEMP